MPQAYVLKIFTGSPSSENGTPPSENDEEMKVDEKALLSSASVPSSETSNEGLEPAGTTCHVLYMYRRALY